MAITVLLFAQAKPGKDEELKVLMAKCLTKTRVYPGCIDIGIYEETEQKGALVFYENWESKEAYLSYLSWRTEQGVMDKIGALLVSAPEINYYNRLAI